MHIKELKENEMMNIDGGTISATFISAIAKVVEILFEIGKETGSAIRRLTTGSYCSAN